MNSYFLNKQEELVSFVSFRLFKGCRWHRPRITSPNFNQLKVRRVNWACNLEDNPHRNKTEATDHSAEVLISPHHWGGCSLLSRVHFHQDIKLYVRTYYCKLSTITSPGLHSTVQAPCYFMLSWHPCNLCLRPQEVALLSHNQIPV